MCQGVIVSIAKFPVKGKTKRVVMRSIGSHSEMVKENKERLFKLGCLMDGTETIVSAESDFTKNKYGLFTVESGKPDKTDLRLIKKAFQDCSGSALKLINHVKKTGKFHGSLVGLLSAPARKIYDESTAPAQKIYDESTAQAQKIYDETTAQAWVKLFKVKKNRLF